MGVYLSSQALGGIHLRAISRNADEHVFKEHSFLIYCRTSQGPMDQFIVIPRNIAMSMYKPFFRHVNCSVVQVGIFHQKYTDNMAIVMLPCVAISCHVIICLTCTCVRWESFSTTWAILMLKNDEITDRAWISLERIQKMKSWSRNFIP